MNQRLRLIAIDSPDPTGFSKACREALQEYEKDKRDLEHELAKFRAKICCDIGLAVFGAAGLAPLVQKAIALGSIESVLLVGGPVFIKYLQERTTELMDLLKQRADLEASSGYALFRPYSFL